MKFENALIEYFNYSKLNLKISTYVEQERKINKYILPFFKGKYINDIDLIDIINWKKTILDHNFKYNYNSFLYYSLTSIFDFLIKYYNVNKNYARIEGNFKNNDINNNGNIWSINEFNKFISVINNKKDILLFKMLYFTGLRKGELLALKWSDIDFINNTININKTITREHTILSPKTNSSNRIISIPINLINELYKLKPKNDEFIFKLSFTSLKRKKDNYCKLSNVKQIKLHEFRHSHACYLYLNGIDIKDISSRLGHSDIHTTMKIYLKNLPKDEKRVIKLLNSVC